MPMYHIHPAPSVPQIGSREPPRTPAVAIGARSLACAPSTLEGESASEKVISRPAVRIPPIGADTEANALIPFLASTPQSLQVKSILLPPKPRRRMVPVGSEVWAGRELATRS